MQHQIIPVIGYSAAQRYITHGRYPNCLKLLIPQRDIDGAQNVIDALILDASQLVDDGSDAGVEVLFVMT